jgi:hypothetical protein
MTVGKILKDLYVIVNKDADGNLVGFPQGGGSSSMPYIRAFEKLSSAKRSRARLGGTIMRVVMYEEVDDK